MAYTQALIYVTVSAYNISCKLSCISKQNLVVIILYVIISWTFEMDII